MTYFVGVDPGLRGCGVAVLRVSCDGASPVVVWAGYVPNTDKENRDCRAWASMAVAVYERVWDCVGNDFDLGDGMAVIEEQQVYREVHWKGDSGDVLQVQGVAAATAVRLMDLFGRSRVRTVLPAVWKGQVPKEVYHETRVQPRLTPEDHQRVVLPGRAKLRLDVWDAVGLALYARDKVSRWVGGVVDAHDG